MPNNLEKFRNILSEMFMFDHAELDFGIYRIMNAKRDEITAFLDNELLPQVRESLAQLETGDRAQVQAELDKAIEAAKTAGFNPDDSPKVCELRAKFQVGPDLEALENEVFSYLTSFFRRYYSKGDFISQRRYKEGVYAIPYEGEEVKLYWANHDQYYIKTTECFRDYTFKFSDGRRVHFKLTEADTEANNVKAAAGQERRFILCETEPVAEENGELFIRFEYRPDPDKRKQTELNAEAASKALAVPGFTDWKAILTTRMPTEKNPNRTLLDKHLADYTARNTFDYFIHKDLGRFLRRELDFYIKSEVMHLDDIDSEEAPKVEQYLTKVKAIRRIANKIIDLLAQLEDFQKKLWLKRKFVVETNYCVTLDRVPEDLYPEIVRNKPQQEEWVRLFVIDEIEESTISPGYSKRLTVDFLKANPFLVLDTRFFSQEFKDRLLASFDDLDERTDGLLVHSENFQALNLLMERYREEVKCIYIDPPYNTSGSEIVYKNEYKHSSWLSLISNRLGLSRYLMSDAAIQCTAIDDAESSYLHQLLASIFGHDNYLATVPIRSKPQGRAVPTGFSPNHEYAIFYGISSACDVGRLPRDEVRLARYKEADASGIFAWANFRGTGANSWRRNRPKLFYPIYVSASGEVFVPDFEWDSAKGEWIAITIPSSCEMLLPIDDEGTERVWSLGWERAQKEKDDLLQARKVGSSWQIFRKYRPHQEGTLPGTWWDDPKYSASESGTKVLKDLFGGSGEFSYPKSVYSVADCLRASNLGTNEVALDFFAGSGTTGHAVINLNREDGGSRKYILVEMGDYFNTVLKPRIQRVIYSKDWKDGKPVSREGSSHLLKYLRLESYEDTLNNLKLKRTEQQGRLLDDSPEFREDFLLHYMLEVESRGSASLLNVEWFEDPFNYQLHIATGSVGETKPVIVDLVETFNYLLGLRVKHVDTIRGFKVIQGTSPEGDKVLVIWRRVGNGRCTVLDGGEEDPTGNATASVPYARDEGKSNADLDAFFLKQEYNTRDMEFDLIYVNGDNNLENLKRPDETWKVRLIETEFKRLMFDVQDV